MLQKILIIKTGYSEFLDSDNNSRKVSLGDILRTTPLLHLYGGSENEVTWMTDPEAMPLLKNNTYIKRLLPINFTTAIQLLEEEFDVVINLEKNHDLCKFAGKIEAWKKYGFRFDKKTNNAEAYDRASEVLTVSSNPKTKKENQRTVQELLFEMVGQKWQGEEYILGYRPKTKVVYDIGLNTLIGQKWPTKAWPMENWNKLEKMLLNQGFSVTRQDKQDENILTNLKAYIDWINSGEIIISNDSLGLHLGIALKKRVLGLFGPTPHKEVFFYNRGKAVFPEKEFECMPCFKWVCKEKYHCLGQVTSERVYKEIVNLKNGL